MQISAFFTLYAIAVPIFLAFDALWLGLIARGFYQNQIGYLLGPVNWVAAIIFYLIFVAGLVFFAMLPALESDSFATAMLLGAIFGGIAYATYDLTNLATIKDWPLFLSIVDIAWGTALGALVSGLTFMAYSIING